MARRSPAQVRESLTAAPRQDRAIRKIPGLTPAGEAAIVKLERTRLRPGAAREALDSWIRFLRDPYHRLFDERYGCGVPECCPDPAELRDLLEVVAHVLPSKDARTFRRLLARLDKEW